MATERCLRSRPFFAGAVLDAISPPLHALVQHLEVVSPLSEEDRQAILALPYKLRTLEAGTYLIREGDPPHRCCVLVSGLSFRQKLTGDGARQIIAIQIPGEAVDFQNLLLGVSDHSVQMLTRGTVADVSRAAFQEISLTRPGVGRAIMMTTLIEASIFREWVLNIGRRSARSRLSHLLCEFACRLELVGLAPDHGFELPMTQEQLADATGLTSVHVNRVLKALEAEGLIARNRRNISFPDWRRLQDVGDFNPRYLHIGENYQFHAPPLDNDGREATTGH
jgi:CRP-like cAMP-binding protein